MATNSPSTTHGKGGGTAASDNGSEYVSECVVCLDAPTTHTCMPCGHQCICGGSVCTTAVRERQQCPMCYGNVEALMEAGPAAAQKRREGKRVYQA